MNTLNLKTSKHLFIYGLIIFLISGCGGQAVSYSGKTANVDSRPVISFTATSTPIPYNTTTTFTWEATNSTSCTSVTSGLSGLSGTYTTPKLTSTTTYILTCTGPGGVTVGSVKITVAPSMITGFVNAGGAGNVTATSENDLTAGMIVTISGTTSYNGPYTVVSATPINFVILHAFVNASETGIWQIAGGMIASCTSTTLNGNGSAITLVNTPSLFNGVAPLSVFFDATGTTSTSTTKPFHNLEYRWDFADATGSPVSGTTWLYGSSLAANNNRNNATGPVASHVFESPGTYLVKLTVTDGANTVSNSCAQIAVQDPDLVFAGNKTVCFSTTNTFPGGCPSGATQVTTSDFTTAINGNMASNRRLLFRRGETFTTSASVSARINQTGPGIIGAYGPSTNAPVVLMSGNATVLTVSSSATPNLKDWRVMDLDLDGTSSTTNSYGVRAGGGFNQFLVLRVNGRNIMRGVEAHVAVLDGANTSINTPHTVWEDWAVVDSSFISSAATGCADCAWRVYLAGKRAVIQGNFLDYLSDPDAQHVIRSGYMSKGIISNNTLARSGPTQHIIKLHAPKWQLAGVSDPTGTGSYTEQVVMADNKIVAGNNNWLVGLGPQNADVGTDERVREIIVERNWFQAGPATGAALLVWGSETTVRNNICDMTGAQSHRCFHVNRRGVEPPPDNVRIYNNTIYSSSTGNFYGVTLDTLATNVSVINNLGSAPFATNPLMVDGAGGAGLISSNNLIGSPASLFVNATPAIQINFGLKTLPNPARDTGLATVPVFSDFFGALRPQNSVIDIGAAEGP